LPQEELPFLYLQHLLSAASSIFESEYALLSHSADAVVVDDLRGQTSSSCASPAAAGHSGVRYLFLGDMVGGGDFSTETATAVLAMKVLELLSKGGITNSPKCGTA
jgi:hypothetical protein